MVDAAILAVALLVLQNPDPGENAEVRLLKYREALKTGSMTIEAEMTSERPPNSLRFTKKIFQDVCARV